jgi:hypothetical protein
MRVSESPARSESGTPGAGKFSDALRRAERVERDGRTRENQTRRNPDPGRELARGDEDGLVAGAARLAPPTADPRAPCLDLAPVPELAAVVRAVPAAIAAGRLQDGAPLTLSFGPSLGVELRSGAAGVELVLVPDARLARAAEADLPRMVSALRVRGVALARAEVRPRAGGRTR